MKKFKVGDWVKFQMSKRDYPRWSLGADRGRPSSQYGYGRVRKVHPTQISVTVFYPSTEPYNWNFSPNNNKTGSAEVIEELPSYLNEPRDTFFVEVDETCECDGMRFDKGLVSRACRPSADNHTCVLLLDYTPDGKHFLESPNLSWLEVSRVSKSTYYRKRSK